MHISTSRLILSNSSSFQTMFVDLSRDFLLFFPGHGALFLPQLELVRKSETQNHKQENNPQPQQTILLVVVLVTTNIDSSTPALTM